MRIVILVVATMLVGTSIGLAVTWIEFRDVNEHFQSVARTPAGLKSDAENQAPPLAVVVGGRSFNFGALNHEQTRDKTFVIRNDGGQPLTVSWTGESCGKCIENKHHFHGATVPPGETCEVIVTYSTKKPGPTFNESAYLTTNDPDQSSIHLEITGDVVKAVRLNPDFLAMNSILASETSSGSVKLLGFQSDDLKLVGHEFSNPELASKFELTTKPLDAAALQEFNHARAGMELQFQVKPGMAIGPFTQNVTLKVQGNELNTLELPITGTVVGDLSVIGKNVDTNQSSFGLGLINKAEGRTAEIFVLVKGPHRDDVQLTIGEVDPPELKVSVGDRTSLADGKIWKHRIIVSIPKGSPNINRLGNAQGKAAHFVLQTTHPFSKEMVVEVRFAVE